MKRLAMLRFIGEVLKQEFAEEAMIAEPAVFGADDEKAVLFEAAKVIRRIRSPQHLVAFHRLKA